MALNMDGNLLILADGSALDLDTNNGVRELLLSQEGTVDYNR